MTYVNAFANVTARTGEAHRVPLGSLEAWVLEDRAHMTAWKRDRRRLALDELGLGFEGYGHRVTFEFLTDEEMAR